MTELQSTAIFVSNSQSNAREIHHRSNQNDEEQKERTVQDVSKVMKSIFQV